MRFSNRIFAVLVGSLTLWLPGGAQADAIGLSQATTDPMIYQGDVLEETIVITRSNTENDQTFLTELEGLELFDLRGQDRVVLLAGQDTQTFTFGIDASDAEVGVHDGYLKFVLENSTVEDGASVAFRYGLTATYHVSVVERPDPSVTLFVEDYPALMNDIAVTSISVDQMFVDGGKQLGITWSLKNDGSNPVGGVESLVTITRRGRTFHQSTSVSPDVMPAHGVLQRKSEFLLSDHYPSGRYEVHVKVGDTEETTALWVVHIPLLWTLCAVIVSTIVGGVAFALMKMGTKKRRRR